MTTSPNDAREPRPALTGEPSAAGGPVDPSVLDGGSNPSVARERCTARSSRTGARCGRWPSRGSRVCTSHGAAAPQVRRAARRRVARDEALRAARLFGVPDVGADPAEVLAREVGDLSGTVRALRAALDELDANDAVHGPGRGVVDLHGERQHRLMQMCTTAVRLGVEQRSAVLVEQLAAAVANVGRRLVAELDLDERQRERAHLIVRAGLRELIPLATTNAREIAR